MKCFFCDQNMDKIITSYCSKWGSYELIIKGVSAYECKECERLVFDPEEARMIQNITAGLMETNVNKPDIKK